MVKTIDYNTAINFLITKHYSGRKPQIKYAFGLYESEKLVAVCTYGIPASRSLCIGIMGEGLYQSVIELNRLCRIDECKTQMSKFIAYTLKEIKKHNLLVVSYADTGMKHVGAIYQATNFIYTGITKARTDKYTPNNKHSRHYTNEFNHLRKLRTAKHRYIYFACDKRHKKIFLNNLKYKISNFPKGDKIDYKLGEFQKPIIYNKLTNKYFTE
jgi:hypothetical protein